MASKNSNSHPSFESLMPELKVWHPSKYRSLKMTWAKCEDRQDPHLSGIHHCMCHAMIYWCRCSTFAFLAKFGSCHCLVLLSFSKVIYSYCSFFIIQKYKCGSGRIWKILWVYLSSIMSGILGRNIPGSGTCLLYVVVVMIVVMMMVIMMIIFIIIITIMITNLHSFYPLPCTSVEPCGTHVFIYLGALEPYHLAMAVSRSQGLCLVLESRRQQVRIKPAFIFKTCKLKQIQT